MSPYCRAFAVGGEVRHGVGIGVPDEVGAQADGAGGCEIHEEEIEGRLGTRSISGLFAVIMTLPWTAFARVASPEGASVLSHPGPSGQSLVEKVFAPILPKSQWTVSALTAVMTPRPYRGWRTSCPTDQPAVEGGGAAGAGGAAAGRSFHSRRSAGI